MTVKKCTECKENRHHHAGGLCSRCYRKFQARRRRKDSPEKFKIYDKARWKGDRRDVANGQRRARYYANYDEEIKNREVYRKKNREKIYAQQKEYYRKNINKIRQKNREYNKKRDPVKEFARLRKWVKEQPIEKIRNLWRMTQQRRAARKKNLPATLTKQEWEQIQKDYEYRCAYCGDEKFLTQDHIVPVVKGGAYTAENIAPACLSCNSKKKDRDLDVFLAELDIQINTL